LGELRALAILNSSLNSTYRIKIKNILLSDQPLGERIENDIILLGGPKHNHLTKIFLDRIQGLSVVDQNEEHLIWKSEPKFNFAAKKNPNGKIEVDYGLIIRTKNPFSSDGSTVCLFSGQHTYGVIAAAFYFVNNYGKITSLKTFAPTIISMVSCDVIDDYPNSIRLIREYVSWR
jgi:hypothetical protein